MLYREVQKPRSFLIWIVASILMIFLWYAFFQQVIFGNPVGDKPAPDVVLIVMWFLFGIAFPFILLFFTKLIIEVHDEGISIQYLPFHFRSKPLLIKDISDYKVITYSALTRFGGWGIRINVNGEKAYIMSGNKGIQVNMQYETLVIGTRNPDELKAAIDFVTKKEN